MNQDFKPKLLEFRQGVKILYEKQWFHVFIQRSVFILDKCVDILDTTGDMIIFNNYGFIF